VTCSIEENHSDCCAENTKVGGKQTNQEAVGIIRREAMVDWTRLVEVNLMRSQILIIIQK
jgi:hypothetical protein